MKDKFYNLIFRYFYFTADGNPKNVPRWRCCCAPAGEPVFAPCGFQLSFRPWFGLLGKWF